MKRVLPFALLALGVASAHAGLVVDESFDGFALGRLEGQGGFLDDPAGDPYRVVASGAGKAIEIDARDVPRSTEVLARSPLTLRVSSAEPSFSAFVDVTSTPAADGLPEDADPGSFGISILQSGKSVASLRVTSLLNSGGILAEAGNAGSRNVGTLIPRNVPKRLGITYETFGQIQQFVFTVDGEGFFFCTLRGDDRGEFAVALNATSGANRGRFDNLTVSGDVTNPVPEPATLAALGLGAATLLKRRRK